MFYDLGLNTIDYFLTPPEIRVNMMSPACQVDTSYSCLLPLLLPQVFPTVTSCQFPTGSLTGTVNIDHALCVLSLNVVNDKIFLVEWCWFLFLTMVSDSLPLLLLLLLLLQVCLLSVLSRLLCLLLPWLRVASLKSTDISFRMEDDKVMQRSWHLDSSNMTF